MLCHTELSFPALQIQWTVEDGYPTFAKLDFAIKTGKNAFRETHGGKSMWEILKVCPCPSIRPTLFCYGSSS